MNLKGKRSAILAENLYQEMELWVPYYRMKEERAEVKVVGAGGARSYTSKHGYPVTVDVQAEAVTSSGISFGVESEETTICLRAS